MASSKAHYLDLDSRVTFLLIVLAGRQRTGQEAQRCTDRFRYRQTAQLPSESDSVRVWRSFLEARRPGRHHHGLIENYAEQRPGALSGHPRSTSCSDRHLRRVQRVF